MINFATRGRLAIKTATLTFVTIGWLTVGGHVLPPVVHKEDPIYYRDYSGAAGLNKGVLYKDTQNLELLKKRILIDDNEILNIIKIWLTLQV